ncbi:hypothetical protein IIE_05259 [Bacillus cereus VD045]|nr:hypothetical protein IIE_05259 [Bacillus cereus VD045]
MYGECLFKKVECLSSKQGKISKQDKSQVIYELRNDFAVKVLLKLAEIPRSTYYCWVKDLIQTMAAAMDTVAFAMNWRIKDTKSTIKNSTNHERVRFEEPSPYEKTSLL